MKKLLLLNPNTTERMTERMRERVQSLLGTRWQVIARTAPFGMAYIADEPSYLIAAHATWQVYEASVGAFDALLVGCFGDPGGFALKADARLPSLGLAEAAMREAAALGDYAIVTGGTAWRPMLARLAYGLGGEIQHRLTHIETIDLTGAQIAADPPAAYALLLAACETARRHAPHIQSVIMGGAGLMGLAAQLQPHFSLPLIDSVDAGARWVATL